MGEEEEEEEKANKPLSLEGEKEKKRKSEQRQRRLCKPPKRAAPPPHLLHQQHVVRPRWLISNGKRGEELLCIPVVPVPARGGSGRGGGSDWFLETEGARCRRCSYDRCSLYACREGVNAGTPKIKTKPSLSLLPPLLATYAYTGSYPPPSSPYSTPSALCPTTLLQCCHPRPPPNPLPPIFFFFFFF